MSNCAIVGINWGDEGKGKITCIFRNINDMFIFKVKNTSIYKPYEKNNLHIVNL